MARRAAVKRRMLGEIPVFHAEGAGPTRAGLLFRVGRADEGAANGGITHVVEHLALYRFGQQPFEYNGIVDATWTGFWVTGSATEVQGFLTGLVEHLANLPVDRLAVEQRILRDESSRRSLSSFDHHAWLRYGLRGPGLAYLDELGLYGLTADAVRAWSASWFTSGNAALVWTGSKLPDLKLDLPAGPRRLPTAPPELVSAPTWAEDGPNLVTASFTTPRTPATAAALRVLSTRLQQRLRYDLGVSYDVSGGYHPLTAEVGLATVAATTAPADAATVRDVFVATIGDLGATGPTAAELLADVDKNRLDEDPFAALGEAARMATQELVGGRVETFDEMERNAKSVTPEAAREGFSAMAERVILTLPPDLPPPPEPFVPYPVHILGTADGTLYPNVRERQFLWGSKFPGIRSGPTMIGVEFPDGSGLRIRWADCVAVVINPDGLTSVLDATGGHISFHPNDLRDGAALARAVDRAVPPALVVRLPADEPAASGQRPPPDGSMKWAIFGAFLLLITATAGFGVPMAVGKRVMEILANGANLLTIVAGLGFLAQGALLPVLVYGAHRSRPWSVAVAAIVSSVAVGATVLWTAGGGNPSYTWVSWVAGIFALGHLLKVRNRRRPSVAAAAGNV